MYERKEGRKEGRKSGKCEGRSMLNSRGADNPEIEAGG
jgi:hypothetical protein